MTWGIPDIWGDVPFCVSIELELVADVVVFAVINSNGSSFAIDFNLFLLKSSNSF
jgi:hypothetical protein